jgi:crotonobetaine/carnitine-CoA ligase
MSARMPRSPQTAFGAGRSIDWLLQVQASGRPNKAFLTWEPFIGQPKTWSYGEFTSQVSRVAAGMRRSGVGRGSRVLVHLDNCPEYLLAWFACARLGAVAVCTNSRSTREELSYYTSHSDARFAVTQPNLEALVAAVMPGAAELWVTSCDGASSRATEKCRRFDSLRAEDDCGSQSISGSSAAFVQYTSGTTGRPKGVVLTHSNALWAARVNAAHEGLTASDIHLVYLPLFHVNAMCYSVLATLWAGSSFVLQPRFSASRFWEVSIRNRCTWASQISFALNALAAGQVPSHSFRMWGAGISGHPLEKRFRVPTLGWWGMTETVSHPIVGDPHIASMAGTIGHPAPEYEVAVVRDDGSAVEPGETGALLVRGVCGVSLFAGYLDDEQATADAFDEDGWFRTGDLVTVHGDGAISFADRAKDMLKVGGENVAASEIERVIISVEGVRQVAVVAGPHPTLAEVPVAFVVLEYERPGIEREIIDACRERLSDFKVPRAVEVVRELPQGTLGKVAKNLLRAQLRSAVATSELRSEASNGERTHPTHPGTTMG